MSKLNKQPLVGLGELTAQACRTMSFLLSRSRNRMVTVGHLEFSDAHTTVILFETHIRVSVGFQQARPRSSDLASRTLVLRIPYSPWCVTIVMELHEVETRTCNREALCGSF